MDAAIDAVSRDALDLAVRMTRKAGTVAAIGVYAERVEVHMGIVWIKALTLRTGHANVIGHVDRVLAMMTAACSTHPARDPSRGAQRRAEAYAGLRPPRGAQDRDDPVSHDVERGTSALLLRRRETLAQGAEPLGWKIGFNLPEIQRKLGLDRPLAGFLTSDGLLEDGRWSLGERRRGGRRVRGGGRGGRRRPLDRGPAPCPRAGRPPTSSRTPSRSWPATSSTAPWPSGRAWRRRSPAPRASS